MRRRQTAPRQWLIVTEGGPFEAVKCLPRGSGVLLLRPPSASEMRRLRQVGRNRALKIVIEGRRSAARVHDLRELRRALLAGTPLVLLSPIYPTESHPNWEPIPRMRAAMLARLGQRRLIALGGMNRKRYARVAQLGFIGWAGISAFRI
jgi:thiamine-phosphate pyrophosphorylase